MTNTLFTVLGTRFLLARCDYSTELIHFHFCRNKKVSQQTNLGKKERKVFSKEHKIHMCKNILEKIVRCSSCHFFMCLYYTLYKLAYKLQYIARSP